jgi:hypothetical protein
MTRYMNPNTNQAVLVVQPFHLSRDMVQKHTSTNSHEADGLPALLK